MFRVAALYIVGRWMLLPIAAMERVRNDRRERRPDGDVLAAGIDSFMFGPYTLEDVDLWLFQVAAQWGQ